MRALILNQDAMARCKEADARARAHPIPWDALMHSVMPHKDHLSLADRKPGFARPQASEHVVIEQGYHVAISYEDQPGALCKHVSISVDAPGFMPNVPAVIAICTMFGISFPVTDGRMWVEEFAPDHCAVNVAVPVGPSTMSVGRA